MIRRSIVALLVAALVTIGAPRVSADPAGNQLTSWSALCTGVTEGVFVWSASQPSQCTSLPNRIIQWSDFTGNVQSSGCGSGNPLPSWSQLVSCRVVSSTVSALTDPWMTSTSTYWPTTTLGGTMQYAADSGITGEPAGAYALTEASSTASSGYVQQTISPNPIAGSTKLVARAYGKVTMGTIPTTSDPADCGTGTNEGGTATGSATIELVNASGTVVEQWSASSASYVQIATPQYTVPSSGAYYVRAYSASASLSGSYYVSTYNPQTQAVMCTLHAVTVYGYGWITGMSIANS